MVSMDTYIRMSTIIWKPQNKLKSQTDIPFQHRRSTEDEKFGHIPLRMVLFVSTFLKWLANKGKDVVTRK